MKSLLSVMALSLGLVVATTAQASLIDRGGGLIYDTDLDITWLADANYAKTSGYDADGLMIWTQAMNWAGNLSYGGYTDWRLPITLIPDVSCSFEALGDPYGYYCIGSEMGHLFYNELGGVADASIATSGEPELALFLNIQSDYYWSATLYEPFTLYGFFFGFVNGFQASVVPPSIYDDNSVFYAWAVRDGDVAAVPLPPAVWLFGSGLMGLAAVARRRHPLRAVT
jgi:hypothetical protein